MSFLKQAAALLRGASDITLRISRDGENLAVVVLPRLGELDPDERNEAKRQLSAALAKPVRLLIAANDDPDAELAQAFASIAAARAPLHDALAQYADGANESLNQARAAAAKTIKGKPPATAPAAKKSSGGSAKTAAATTTPAPEPDAASEQSSPAAQAAHTLFE